MGPLITYSIDSANAGAFVHWLVAMAKALFLSLSPLSSHCAPVAKY